MSDIAPPYRRNRHRWNKLRASIFRIEPFCRLCAEAGRTRAAQELDHIRPLHKGGESWDQHNLQPLCRACHAAKTQAEVDETRPKICPHGYIGIETCPRCTPEGDS